VPGGTSDISTRKALNMAVLAPLFGCRLARNYAAHGAAYSNETGFGRGAGRLLKRAPSATWASRVPRTLCRLFAHSALRGTAGPRRDAQLRHLCALHLYQGDAPLLFSLPVADICCSYVMST